MKVYYKMTIQKIFVFYNLCNGRFHSEIDMFMIPFNWTHVKRMSTSSYDMSPFAFCHQFVGEEREQDAMKNYLFEFFTDHVFKGVVSEFKIQNEFIETT